MNKFLTSFYLILISININAQRHGTLDSSFGTNGQVITSISSYNDKINDVAVQVDGKIVVVGITTNPTGATTSELHVLRYNANGTLDNLFGTAGKVTFKDDSKFFYGENIALQDNGKIIITGTYSDSLLIMRLNTDGSLDNTFAKNGKFTYKNNLQINPFALKLQSNGKILIAGEAFNDGNAKVIVLRCNNNGILDSTFNQSGILILDINSRVPDRAFDITVQSDNKILICGHVFGTLQGDFNNIIRSAILIRLNNDGTIDTSFGTSGIVEQENADARSVKVLADGKILIGGQISESANNMFDAIFKYHTNGTLDKTFGTDGFVKSTLGSGVNSIVVQHDSKIVLATANYVENQINLNLVLSRFNSNGSIDTTFGTNGASIVQNAISTGFPIMTLQNDGKILVVNDFKESDKKNFKILRFNNLLKTSISNVETNEEITVYPNPVSENVDIKFENIDVKDLHLRVINVLGNLVLEKTFDNVEKHQVISLELSKLITGMYFLHFSAENLNQQQTIYKSF